MRVAFKAHRCDGGTLHATAQLWELVHADFSDSACYQDASQRLIAETHFFAKSMTILLASSPISGVSSACAAAGTIPVRMARYSSNMNDQQQTLSSCVDRWLPENASKPTETALASCDRRSSVCSRLEQAASCPESCEACALGVLVGNRCLKVHPCLQTYHAQEVAIRQLNEIRCGSFQSFKNSIIID